MRRMAAAANRTGLIIVGLIGLLLGLAVLALGFGFAEAVVPGLGADLGLAPVAAVLALPFSAAVAILVALILALIGLRWLGAQIPRKDFAKPLRMQRDSRTGVTTVNAEVIAEAVAEDLEATDEVVNAQAILRGTARQPELLIHVDVHERADIDAVVAEITDRVTRNCAQALGSPLSVVAVEIGIARTRRHRQRNVQLD